MSPGKTVTVSVLQPGYLPWLGYFDLAALSDTFVVYDDVHSTSAAGGTGTGFSARQDPNGLPCRS